MANEPAPGKPPAITALSGAGQKHVTDAFAVRVIVYVLAPALGVKSERPTINGAEVAGGAGTAPYEFKVGRGFNVAPLTVQTAGADNELVVIEEFQ